jgi:hypothetical protein
MGAALDPSIIHYFRLRKEKDHLTEENKQMKMVLVN